MWTPRSTITRFRAWPHSPQILEYIVPPPPESQHKRTPTKLTAKSQEDLVALMSEWESQIEALEAQVAKNPMSLKDQLANLMFTKDVAGQVKANVAKLDPQGTGKVNRGEFKTHLRAIGIKQKHADNPALDALFKEWDTDSSGQLNVDEVRAEVAWVRVDSEGRG